MNVKAADLMELPQDAVKQLNALDAQLRVFEVELQRAEAAGMDVAAQKAQLAQLKRSREGLLAAFGPGSAARAARQYRTPGQ